MSGCAAVAMSGTLAETLKNLDCQTGQATAVAFGRMFGSNGHLVTALTILLTLYVAFFAIGLLTGRTRAGIAVLTPRMMTLGLVLTFATSWMAYQSVVWTLASGAPDEIASIVAGTDQSATTVFADRLDGLFVAVADSADRASKPAPPTETGITPPTPMVGGFTASTVLWLSALLLLLGSVGVLVTSKIALAALLALGPVFIVMALFPGTRGLFEGWLRTVVLLAIVPLFAVLIGGGAIAALEPVARAVSFAGEEPSARAVGTLFLGSVVFLALMIMAIKASSSIVMGWRLPRAAAGSGRDLQSASDRYTISSSNSSRAIEGSTATVAASADERVRGMIAAVSSPYHAQPTFADRPGPLGFRSANGVSAIPRFDQVAAAGSDRRTVDVGRRFAPLLDQSAREKIS